MSDTQTVVNEQTDVSDAPGTRQGAYSRVLSRMPRAGWGILIFLALFVIGGLLRPSLFSMPGLISTATFAAILAVASYGQTIAVIQGGIDLSVPNTIAFAALGFLTWNSSFGPVVALALALASGLVIGILNGVIVAKGRPDPDRDDDRHERLLFGLLLLNFPLSELTVVPDLVSRSPRTRSSSSGCRSPRCCRWRSC
ncbi:hypothetical protein [Agromyces flavus]|uniref:hypothetical protein n=1 Tax=Agromyces flavus TaxID=589382 RepID=UPI00361120E0